MTSLSDWAFSPLASPRAGRDRRQRQQRDAHARRYIAIVRRIRDARTPALIDTAVIHGTAASVDEPEHCSTVAETHHHSFDVSKSSPTKIISQKLIISTNTRSHPFSTFHPAKTSSSSFTNNESFSLKGVIFLLYKQGYQVFGILYNCHL